MEITQLHSAGFLASSGPDAPSAEDVQQRRALGHAASSLNVGAIFGQDRELTFAVDPDSRRTVVRIVDSTTHELVDQFPAEYLLRLAADQIGQEKQSSNGELFF